MYICEITPKAQQVCGSYFRIRAKYQLSMTWPVHVRPVALIRDFHSVEFQDQEARLKPRDGIGWKKGYRVQPEFGVHAGGLDLHGGFVVQQERKVELGEAFRW